MALTTHYRIDRPSIVSETIDGEAVILDLRLGAYYSIRGTGVVVWTGFDAGLSLDEIAALLQSGHKQAFDAPAATAAFVTQLLEHRLIVEGVEPETAPQPAYVAEADFVAPSIERYSDMEDLLLLDPIHDVQTETGWPARKH